MNRKERRAVQSRYRKDAEKIRAEIAQARIDQADNPAAMRMLEANEQALNAALEDPAMAKQILNDALMDELRIAAETNPVLAEELERLNR
jgi:hypothetical protein